MIASTIRPSTLAVSSIVSPRPSCMSSGESTRLVPPRRAIALTNDTRVRVDGRSKMRAMTRPSSSAGHPDARWALRRSAVSRIAATASGGWWRSVSSERPAKDGAGVKASQFTGEECSQAHPAAWREPSERGNRFRALATPGAL